ncbi:Transposable element Tcb2 transposase [Araneus ventricosus]|uniref:Transposable element Tcb2 transposase n=1 Tax=Araneus ventricosus TaxID=182803 RepID=A0A4Y2S567_ARAVE|nr:Transposable element Tcb2 transposase [Araneus ventricosus]
MFHRKKALRLCLRGHRHFAESSWPTGQLSGTYISPTGQLADKYVLPTGQLADKQIVGARRIGHSVSEILREIGFSRSTVSRVYREYTDGGKTSDRVICKRQLDLNERGVRRLNRIVHSQRSQTLSQITTQLSRTVFKRAVQRSPHRMGFGSHRPTRVPLLNARHRTARLAWARGHREWTLEDWKRVAWSDESRFQLLHVDGRLRIWRQAHEAVDPAYKVGTVQGHGGSIMVWGVSSWQFLGSLVLVPTSLNAIRYVELLGDHLHPFMLYYHPHGNGVFQLHLSQVQVGYCLVG